MEEAAADPPLRENLIPSRGNGARISPVWLCSGMTADYAVQRLEMPARLTQCVRGGGDTRTPHRHQIHTQRAEARCPAAVDSVEGWGRLA